VPAYLTDSNGNLIKHSVLSGRAHILQLKRYPGVWLYRQLIPKQRRYIERRLGVLPLEAALKQAEDLYLKLQDELDTDGQPMLSSHSCKAAIERWLKLNEERFNTGQITQSAYKGKEGVLMGPLTHYLQHKSIKKVSQLQLDTFLDYRTWRLTEGYKLVKTRGGPRVPRESTVKKDLVQIKDWFANFLIPRGYTTVMPTFESIVIRKDELDANPPIPLKPDWVHIYKELDRWAEAGKSFNNQRVGYWRQLFRHFCLISYNAGTRPQELYGAKETKRIQQWDGTFQLQEEIIGGIRWEDVEVYEATHLSASGKPFTVLEATIYIRKSKTGEPREVPYNTGMYFKRLREIADLYRKENNLPALTPKDFVFFNPYTSQPYPYTQWQKSWDRLVTELGDKLNPVRTDRKYTMRSMRSSYITNQINEGKDIYLIKKITGHSLEILTRHYDRSEVKKRRSEVTARTYGKPEEGGKTIDLNALPVEKTTDSQSPKRSRVSVRRNNRTKPGNPKFDAVVEEAIKKPRARANQKG
jgi:integrase